MNRIEMSSDGFSNKQIIEFRKIINGQIKNVRKKSRHDKLKHLLKSEPF